MRDKHKHRHSKHEEAEKRNKHRHKVPGYVARQQAAIVSVPTEISNAAHHENSVEKSAGHSWTPPSQKKKF